MLLQSLKNGIKSGFNAMPNKFKKKIRNMVLDENFQQGMLDEFLDLCSPTTNRERQKRIFKKNVFLVELEVASFCNRTCWFCPNSFIDRKSTSVELDEKVYISILKDLKEIDYCEALSFHRFNEPLANKELILKRIKQAREHLPKAVFTIFTNGDYLDSAYIKELEAAGVNHILMSYYFNKNIDFDVKNVIRPNMEKVAKKLGVEFVEVANDEFEFAMSGSYKNLNIRYCAWNPKRRGTDRGGSIEINNAKKKIYGGCFQLQQDFYVDYNGLVMPCCNTRSDVEAHKNFVLGDVHKSSIFDIYTSEKFCAMRKKLFRGQLDNPICKNCSDRRGMGYIMENAWNLSIARLK